MGINTSIEWCDSACNPVMGCDGCELWDPKNNVFICYAGQIHRIRAGRPGYADEFLVPKTFAGRMAEAARWRDLTGTDRLDKPWLNKMPRVVFISDMGDALSESVPFEFLRDEVVRVVTSWRHIGMWLTKQPQRMAEFAEWLAAQGIAWPANLWAGTSITGSGQGARVRHLLRVPAAVRFLSIEPVLRDPGELDLDGISLVILGGASGPKAPRTEIDDLRAMKTRADRAGCRVFVKQVGANVVDRNDVGFEAEHDVLAEGPDTGQPTDSHAWPTPADVEHDINGFREEYQGALVRIRLADKKGGDPKEWPADLRVRQFPVVRP